MHFEIIRAIPVPNRVRVAVFDFDGTVSLLRSDWQRIMIELAGDLIPPRAGETRAEAARERREDAPGAPGIKALFLERLLRSVEPRIRAIETRSALPQTWQMPGVAAMLQSLQRHSIPCYLVSGTDEEPVRRESEMLGLAGYFQGIYGATLDVEQSRKAVILARIAFDHAPGGSEFVAFGDGVEEIRVSKSLGGIAIGLAPDERRNGTIDPEQRARLIEAGADVIIPDFRTCDKVMQYLFG